MYDGYQEQWPNHLLVLDWGVVIQIDQRRVDHLNELVPKPGQNA